jgi:hypothetical protein
MKTIIIVDKDDKFVCSFDIGYIDERRLGNIEIVEEKEVDVRGFDSKAIETVLKIKNKKLC